MVKFPVDKSSIISSFSISLDKYLCEKKNSELLNSLLDHNSIIMQHFKKKKIEEMISSEKNIKLNLELNF